MIIELKRLLFHNEVKITESARRDGTLEEWLKKERENIEAEGSIILGPVIMINGWAIFYGLKNHEPGVVNGIAEEIERIPIPQRFRDPDEGRQFMVGSKEWRSYERRKKREKRRRNERH